VEAEPNKLSIYYFEERNSDEDSYEEILDCVKNNGVAKCKDLAASWLETTVPDKMLEQKVIA